MSQVGDAAATKRSRIQRLEHPRTLYFLFSSRLGKIQGRKGEGEDCVDVGRRAWGSAWVLKSSSGESHSAMYKTNFQILAIIVCHSQEERASSLWKFLSIRHFIQRTLSRCSPPLTAPNKCKDSKEMESSFYGRGEMESSEQLPFCAPLTTKYPLNPLEHLECMSPHLCPHGRKTELQLMHPAQSPESQGMSSPFHQISLWALSPFGF